LHGTAIAEALAADPILVPEGEAAKDWAILHQLLAGLAERGVARDTPIVALGGGSVGDLAGLAASLFKRGCPIVHLPTTLLAQADSAIGGKTAIDAFGEKNLIGTFHQPALVVADPAFLDTLDERQLRSGYAEIVKYGLIDDPAFFVWCEANGRGVLAGHRDLRQQAVVTAIRAKSRIVSGDVEDRSGKRALLNLGHSFAHAIEAEVGLGAILHGEAVALGMTLAFRFSSELGLCPAAETEQVAAHLSACGLPTRLTDIGLAKRGAKLTALINRDKKNSAGRIALILVRGIGRAFFDPAVDGQRLAAFLDRAP
jgi:3-dehydroquinate synthase